MRYRNVFPDGVVVDYGNKDAAEKAAALEPGTATAEIADPELTTVEDWEAEIMHRLALTSGVDPSTFGPNIKALIRLQAEQLHAFEAMFKGQMALIDQVVSSVKTGPLIGE